MTIPGVDATVALSIVAAVGDFTRFHTPERLVSYFRLNSAGAPIRRPAGQARITKQRRHPARCARSISACAPAAAGKSLPS